MPLRLNLRPNEQIMINGAVITNLKRRSFLAIHNEARIIPGKFILKASRAETPVRRVYFACQMAYVFSEDPEELKRWVSEFDARLSDVLGVVDNPEIVATLAECAQCFSHRSFYKTLKLLQDVIAYEDRLFAMAGHPSPPAFGDGLSPPPEGGEEDDEGETARDTNG